jgi:iron complex outermembrane receptor protein
VEFGASFVRNSIAISADAYYNDLTDLINNQLEFNQQFKGVNVQVVETPTNSGNAYTYGFTTKIDLHQQIGMLKLQSYAAYSYSDGKTDGAPLAYSAKNTIKAGVLFKIGKFSIDPRMIYRSASLQGFVKDSDNNPAHNSAFTLINLFTTYKLTKNIEVNMKIKNLLNARYYNVSYGGDEAFAATPQDPFAIYGGVLVKF